MQAALNLSISNQPPVVAAGVMAESTFCLAPTGDSKGFTARMYYALMHGCIPVRLDSWVKRRLPLERLVFPFSSLLNWSRLVVNYDTFASERLLRNGSLLLAQLRDMPPAELHDRLQAVHEAAQWLSYDRPIGGQDAPGALLLELHRLAARLNDPAGMAAILRKQADGEQAACRVASARGRPCQNATDDWV